LRATDISELENTGRLPPLDGYKLTAEPNVPSLIQVEPEKLDAIGLRETTGAGTAACAGEIKRLLVKSKKTPAMIARVFFTLLITD